MSSKKLAVAGFVLLAVFGCSKRHEPTGQEIAVHFQSTGDCISNIGTELKNFSEGKAGAAEINAFWTCMANSIHEFERLTTGDTAKGGYSAGAIRHFIEHYFLERHISDPLLASAMEFKRVLLSGTADEITPAELAHSEELFAELNAISLELQPHARVIFRKDKAASDEQVRAAAVSLQRALARLAVWLNRENQKYTFVQLNSFVAALVDWEKGDAKASSTMHSLQQAALIFPELKTVVIGADPLAIGGQDWSAIATVAGRGLFLFLAGANGLDNNLDNMLNRDTLPESANQVVDALADGVRAHAGGQIPLVEWTNLFTKISQTDWLPTDATPDALNALFTWILFRPLGDGATPPTGLTLEQVEILRKPITNWLTLLRVQAQDPQPLVQDFNKIIAASIPIAWDDSGRMQFPVNEPDSWTASGRRHMIWPYAILRFLKEAYVGPTVATLNKDDMYLAVHEVLPLLQNFGWLQSTNMETIGSRLLREADLFTLASNGNELLDLNEAVRYLAFVSSSYRVAQIWLSAADQSCHGRSSACVRTLATNLGNGLLSSMPRLQKVISAKWPAGQLVTFIEHAESACLGDVVSGDFATGDLLEVVQLMSYVEIFMARFDGNQDDIIDLKEAWIAYPIYGLTLGHLVGDPPEDRLQGFYTYMLKNGDTPIGLKDANKVFNAWLEQRPTWSIAADRDILMSILSQLAKL